MSKRHHPPSCFVRQCLRYENGKLFWNTRPVEHFPTARECNQWNIRYAGKEAGCIDRHARGSRWIIGLCGRNYRRSQLVWLVFNDTLPALIDHKNRIKLDDRIDNLRPASYSQNGANSKKPSTNSSGVKGVSWHAGSKKWKACLQRDGKDIYLGLFDSLESAASAYAAAANTHFGQFAQTA